jgi:hypothetical protein
VHLLGIDLRRAQHAAGQNVGEAAGLLDADPLALEVGERLDLLLDAMDASSLGIS